MYESKHTLCKTTVFFIAIFLFITTPLSVIANDTPLSNFRRQSATSYVWDILQKYAHGEDYLIDPYVTGSDGYYSYEEHLLTPEQFRELQDVAYEITRGYVSDYEKISAIYEYVAKTIYYDLDYANGQTTETYIHPYEVWVNKISVCAGYARLTRTLLISIGIPCMDLYGERHEYNAAYDRDEKRWIFMDTTWASGNQYSAKAGKIKGAFYAEYFDSSIDFIASLEKHEIYNLYNLSINGYSYWLDNDTTDWEDMSTWHFHLQSHRGRQTK